MHVIVVTHIVLTVLHKAAIDIFFLSFFKTCSLFTQAKIAISNSEENLLQNILLFITEQNQFSQGKKKKSEHAQSMPPTCRVE